MRRRRRGAAALLLASLSIRGIRRWSRGRRRRRVSMTVVAAFDDLVRFGPRCLVLRLRVIIITSPPRDLFGLGIHRHRGSLLLFRAFAAVRGDEVGVEGGFVHFDPPRRRLFHHPSRLGRGARDDITRRGHRRDDDDDDDVNERLPVAASTSWRSSSWDLLDDIVRHDLSFCPPAK